MTKDDVISAKEFARLAKTDEETIMNWVKDQQLTYVIKWRNKIWFKKSDVERLIKELEIYQRKTKPQTNDEEPDSNMN